MASSDTLTTRLATRQAQLATAETTYATLLEKLNRSYMFAGGEGSQQATKIRLKEIREEIEWLQQEIDAIENRLHGGGVVRLHTSRWK